MQFTEFEAIHIYTHVVRTIPYIRVLTKQDERNEYAERDLRKLLKLRKKMKDYILENKLVSETYLTQIT